MIWNESKECMSRDEMHALQSARLVKMVERVYYNVPFYRKKMQEMGLELGDVKGIEDITKLPFTTKSDLRDNYPFGLLAVPRSEIVRVHASSGTTGKATVVAYTRKDLDLWSECVARAFTMADFSRLAVTLPQRIQSETVFSFTSSCNHTTPFLLSLLSYPYLSHCCSFPLFSASFIYSFSDSAPTLIQHQRTNPYTRNTAAAATINTVFVIFFSP